MSAKCANTAATVMADGYAVAADARQAAGRDADAAALQHTKHRHSSPAAC